MGRLKFAYSVINFLPAEIKGFATVNNRAVAFGLENDA